ncbi:MAG TPA: hypothetical protein VLB07_03355, partial [Woeseiaceae bacterium]|nr:hypothetical protein [Woeseiaceae bacterium]
MKTATAVAEEPPGSAARRRNAPPEITLPNNNTPTIRLDQTIAKRDRSRFRVSDRSAEFLNRCYPSATVEEWNDWRWQNRNRVRTLADLERMITLSDDEVAAIRRHTGALPVGITPYYASLLHRSDSGQALRRTVV